MLYKKRTTFIMKISIVTVTYNSASTIESTTLSVFKQTYSNIEYWVIDGCVSDHTLDIIRKYEQEFNGRLHWISETDKGIYDAMNRGIQHCTGDIIGILNSDDFFTSNDVVEKIEKAFDEGIDAVYGDVHFIHNDNPDKCVRYYSSAIFNPMMLRFGFMPAHPTFYVRRHIYEKYGLYSLHYKIASDYDMMVRLFYKYHIKAKYINMDFVTMRTGGASTKNIRNRLLTTKEDVMACRNYRLKTNLFLISFKYMKKIFEFKLR